MKRKAELKGERNNASLHGFKTRGIYPKKLVISRPNQYDFARGDRSVVSGRKNEMAGVVNKGFEENFTISSQQKTYLSPQSCYLRSLQQQSVNEDSIRPDILAKQNKEIKQHKVSETGSFEGPATARNENTVQVVEEDDRRQSTERNVERSAKQKKQFTKIEQHATDGDQNVASSRKEATGREGLRIEEANEEDIEETERIKEGLQLWRARKPSQGNQTFLSFDNSVESKDEENCRVVYKCRRNPPINPSIIVTTEPFDNIEKLRQIYEEKANEAVDSGKSEATFHLDDNDVTKMEWSENTIENDTITGYSVNARNKALALSDSKDNHGNISALPITEINDLYDSYGFEPLYPQTGGESKISSSVIDKSGNKMKPKETSTPILSAIADQKQFEAIPHQTQLLKRQHEAELEGQEGIQKLQQPLVKTGNEVMFSYRNTPQQISLSDVVKLLRKKRNALANGKTTTKKRSRGARSTESSLKSTDADDGDSDASVGRDELRGVFKNLSEQHKMIEKRSDALINFRPDNRCDTRLVSTAYELASAVEQQRLTTKGDNLNKTSHNTLYHEDFDHNALGLGVHVIQTSKPSTNTSYFNADSESLQSCLEKNKEKLSPNWLYITFAVLVWSSVVAFMHGIEGDKMTSCNQSIKWRLWCTLSACVIIDFFLEFLYEKRSCFKALLSSVLLLAVLLFINEHPLLCYGNGDTTKVLNYLRASVGILLAAFLFVFWLKNGHFNLERVATKYDCRQERKLSELPIYDFENR